MGQYYLSRKILVVDDNVDAAELVALLLTLQGHECAFACNGVDALEAAHRLDPDVIFLDIGMVGMNGYEVALKLRQSARFASTRIVALTAWGNNVARDKAKASGFDSHLVKPACLSELISESASTHRIYG